MKNERVVNFYNKRYSAEGPEREPIPLVHALAERMHHGSVLELGAGRGANSFFLKAKGLEVLATDVSPVAVEAMQKRAEVEKIPLHTQVLDIAADKLPGNFDAIICAFTLHHLDRADAFEVIKKMQEHTNQGGYNVITTFTKKGTFYAADSMADSFYLDNKEELEALYQGWALHKSFEREGMVRPSKAPDEKHPNTFAGLLAQKP